MVHAFSYVEVLHFAVRIHTGSWKRVWSNANMLESWSSKCVWICDIPTIQYRFVPIFQTSQSINSRRKKRHEVKLYDLTFFFWGCMDYNWYWYWKKGKIKFTVMLLTAPIWKLHYLKKDGGESINHLYKAMLLCC